MEATTREDIMKCTHGLVFALVLMLPVATYSQSGFYRLPMGETAFGIGLNTRENVASLTGQLDYGIGNDSKLWLAGGVSFVDDSRVESLGGDIPPSPAAGIGITTATPLGPTGLEYISNIYFLAELARIVEDDATLLSLRTFDLGIMSGILKRIETQSELVFKPFFALNYGNRWLTMDSNPLGINETESDDAYSGQLGLELEMTPAVSLLGTFVFAFESSDTVFALGLNFHPGQTSKAKVERQKPARVTGRVGRALKEQVQSIPE